jgi:hypothetical protein
MTSSSWSPFECLAVAEQTSSGLLQKETSEVEITQRSNIELRSGNAPNEPMVPMTAQGQSDSTTGKRWIDRCLNLNLELTTHRLVFWKVERDLRLARFIHLSHLMQASAETGFMKSPKILLTTYSGDFLLIFSSA